MIVQTPLGKLRSFADAFKVTKPYILCLQTSAACAYLLFQGYARSSTLLLL